jgi:hypothetical protein
VVYYYTNRYLNFSYILSQRSEGYYPILHIMINGQLSFKESAQRLTFIILSLLKTLDLDKNTSERDRPRLL